jgi:serine/threonine protein kinase
MENSGLDFDQITRTGQTLGSPAYMSPEQCLGYKLDARSDIYALGCTMYEAVAGHPPFTANSILEYMHKHTYEAPPQLEIHSEEPNFGYNLAHVIMQALSKAPEERQQSMAQLRDQLQCCVWDEKEAAEKLPPLPPPPPPPQPQKPRRTAFTQLRVLISNLTPLVVLLIVIALGVFVVRNNPLQLGAPETSQSRSLDEQSPSTAVNHHRTTHGVSHH